MWEQADTCEAVIGIIADGYKIPFRELPTSDMLHNNKSARDNSAFMDKEIEKLLTLGSISDVHPQPCVVNPLTVANNRSGKPRLVLNCRHIIPCLPKFRFKYEDVSVARDILSVGGSYFFFRS